MGSSSTEGVGIFHDAAEPIRVPVTHPRLYRHGNHGGKAQLPHTASENRATPSGRIIPIVFMVLKMLHGLTLLWTTAWPIAKAEALERQHP